MKRVHPLSVAVGVFSLVLAGAIGQFRDNASVDDQMTSSIGTPVEVNEGQQLSVVGVDGGRFYRGDYNARRGATQGRFVAVTFTATTTHDRGIGQMICQLRTATDSELHPVDFGRVTFPFAGFRTTTTLLWEVPTDQLRGLSVRCTESSVLTYREVVVTTDLGLTGSALDEFVTRTASNELRSREDEMTVIE
ncbi:hypothetical protein [Aestuariimicrobium ganziense]|uniref:hypothetical protein n=1 Tax=Aestuariimicrobium ganziense TaxID=2773677 RepID=UPI0019432089|nr:hypothetical protein [Aestuariimicrobium ganziense]